MDISEPRLQARKLQSKGVREHQFDQCGIALNQLDVRKKHYRGEERPSPDGGGQFINAENRNLQVGIDGQQARLRFYPCQLCTRR